MFSHVYQIHQTPPAAFVGFRTVCTARPWMLCICHCTNSIKVQQSGYIFTACRWILEDLEWYLAKMPQFISLNDLHQKLLTYFSLFCFFYFRMIYLKVATANFLDKIQLQISGIEQCKFSSPRISQDFVSDIGIFLQIAHASKCSWKKRSCHQGKKEVACLLSITLQFLVCGDMQSL